MTYFQGGKKKNQSTETEQEMLELLELADNDFKIATVNMRREMENTYFYKKEQELLEVKNHTI